MCWWDVLPSPYHMSMFFQLLLTTLSTPVFFRELQLCRVHLPWCPTGSNAPGEKTNSVVYYEGDILTIPSHVRSSLVCRCHHPRQCITTSKKHSIRTCALSSSTLHISLIVQKIQRPNASQSDRQISWWSICCANIKLWVLSPDLTWKQSKAKQTHNKTSIVLVRNTSTRKVGRGASPELTSK